ncbi:MAG: DUF1232 domain-containing protein [Candidatus Aegiribacteria sp.]|nr:DUF1232 domain-containing protein [Candidatus Aegiribacteria sp.]
MTRRNISEEEARGALEKGARNVSDEDVTKVVKKAEEIEGKFRTKGPLKRFIDDVKLMISLVKDYANGNYRSIPYWTIAAVVAALIYVINPVDLIPDFIPVIGFVDDAAVVSVCLLLVEQDLVKYREWKAKQ